MPNDRERGRAKRRYAKRQTAAASRTARRQSIQAVVATVVTVLVVIGGVLGLSRLAGDRTAKASSSATAAATAPKSATSDSPNPCAPPAPTTPATAPSYAQAPPKTLAGGKVWDATVTTTCGVVELELYGDKAPQTVSSFIFLSRKGFYTNSPCHRVTSGASLNVVQCGDPTGAGTGGPGYGYGIENAPADGAYPAGTLAMARTDAPDSNGSQFFVTYADSTLPTEGGGYSIFGKVTKGLDVFTTVAAGGAIDGQSDGAPARAISIKSITVSPR